MARPKGKHDVAPIIRAGFLNGLKEVQNRTGKTFSQIFADLIESDPIAVMNAVAKFTVRESDVNVTETVTFVDYLKAANAQPAGTRQPDPVEGEPESVRH